MACLRGREAELFHEQGVSLGLSTNVGASDDIAHAHPESFPVLD